jgi:hypothetical protein
MALFVESTLRQRAHAEVRKGNFAIEAKQLLIKSSTAYTKEKVYDIFLSHNLRDAELILGMKGTLEDLGYSIYVDWIEDPQFDRSKVTPATANKLRQRMNSSKSLFYITTENSDASRWMPWECGYFDGKKEKVAIVPVQKNSKDNIFAGREYLGLYPYIVKQANINKKEMLWVRKSSSRYIDYNTWVKTLNSQLEWRES